MLNPIECGIRDYNHSRFEQAIENFTKALATPLDQPLAYAYLAFICAAQGLNDEAACFIEQAKELAPSRHDFVAALGEAFLKAGNAEEALKYLKAAVSKQADMFSVYPAMSEALRLTGQIEAAIQLLGSAVGIPSAEQENILTLLLEMLANRGDIDSIAEICLRVRHISAYHSLAIQLLSRTEASAYKIENEVRWHARRFFATLLSPPRSPAANRLLTLGFLVSNFERESRLGRLESLLINLQVDHFKTVVIDNDAAAKNSETAQRCSLVSDQWLSIKDLDDSSALRAIDESRLDILIDLDGYGAKQRLEVLSAINTPFKATWGADLIPCGLGSHCRLLIGESILPEDLPANSSDEFITLPEMGEIYQFPEEESLKKTGETTLTTFGCLTAAVQISSETWQLYGRMLSKIEESTITINLVNLGEQAQEYITNIFASHGVNRSRLKFIHASSINELCDAWKTIRFGLGPRHGSGDMALPCCLWMNTLFVAMDAPSLWSRRPAALLRTIGLPELIASDEESYMQIARTLLSGSYESMENTLRRRIKASQLTDQSHFASGFSNALLKAFFGDAQ